MIRLPVPGAVYLRRRAHLTDERIAALLAEGREFSREVTDRYLTPMRPNGSEPRLLARAAA